VKQKALRRGSTCHLSLTAHQRLASDRVRDVKATAFNVHDTVIDIGKLAERFLNARIKDINVISAEGMSLFSKAHFLPFNAGDKESLQLLEGTERTKNVLHDNTSWLLYRDGGGFAYIWWFVDRRRLSSALNYRIRIVKSDQQ
jgi:hypothetical protein